MSDIHPTAVIGEGVRLGEGTRVGPYAIIEEGVTLGKDNSSIGFSMADWGPDAVEEALDVARGVVIDVRDLLASGEPFPHYDGKVYDPILRAVVGEKLIGVGTDR